MTKTYEELLKLDAERTQGEWQFKSGLFQYGENHPKDTYDAVLCENASPYEEIASNEPYYPVRVETQDLRFIAAAPEMMAMLKEERAKAERYRKALETLSTLDPDGIFDTRKVAKEALKDA